MANDILPIKPISVSPVSPDIQKGISSQSVEKGESFGDVLNGLLSEANKLQNEANKSVEDLAAGKVDNVHDVMIAMNKAELSFKYVMEVRNKLVDAYKEVMRMQF